MKSGICRSILAAFVAISMTFAAEAVRADDGTPIRIGVLRSSLFTAIHGVANQGGYYARNGLNPEITEFQSGQGTAGLESLLSGRLDAYIGTMAELARVNSAAIRAGKEPPLMAVAAGAPGTTTLVLRKDLPFNSAKDLKGLRIGVSSLGSNHLVIFRHYLAENNESVDSLDINLVRVGGSDMPSALLTDQIDGFLHSEPTPSIAIIKGNGKRELTREALGEAGDAPNVAVAVRRDWAEAHSDAVRRLVKALEEASQDYDKIPAAELITILSNYVKAEQDVLEQASQHVDPRLHNLEKMADAFWNVNVAAMKERGEVVEALEINDVFNFDYSAL